MSDPTKTIEDPYEPLDGLTKELSENQKIYDAYFDLEFARALADQIFEILGKYYFRAKMIGFENGLDKQNNPERPLLYISNHSGMSFPWDGMMMCAMFLRKNNYELKEAFRPIVAPILSMSTLMNPYLIKDFWKRAGAVDATFKNLETMLHYQNSNLLVYPEGVAGISKGFNKRYKLQKFSSSFVYNCIKYKTDAVAVVTVNGEYINPYSYGFDWLNKLLNKIGIPFLPICWLTLLLPLQPWIFYFSLPAKLTYIRTRRIKPYEMTDKSIEELSRVELQEIAEICRLQVQEDLDKAVEKYGKEPYALKEHLRTIFQNLQLFPYTIPPFWPFLFAEFERAYEERKKTGKPMDMRLGKFSILRILFQNPIIFCYFIPIIGWIPILIKGYRNSKIK